MPPALTARGAHRLQAIVEAAAALFMAKGFDAVTIDEVVAGAGGSKSNIYRQFGGKEGLFAEVVTHLSAEFLSPLTHLDLGETERSTGLLILGRTLLRQLLNPRHIAFQRMVLASSGQFPDLMAHWYEVGPRQSQKIIAAFLGGEEGDADTKAARMAILFHDMIVTDLVNRAMMGMMPEQTEIEQILQCAVSVMVQGA